MGCLYLNNFQIKVFIDLCREARMKSTTCTLIQMNNTYWKVKWKSAVQSHECNQIYHLNWTCPFVRCHRSQLWTQPVFGHHLLSSHQLNYAESRFYRPKCNLKTITRIYVTYLQFNYHSSLLTQFFKDDLPKTVHVTEKLNPIYFSSRPAYNSNSILSPTFISLNVK